MLETFYETFKTPHEWLLDKLWHKSFSMASNRGQKRPKTKMTKKVQFWNLVVNIIHEDHKKPKIIQKIKLEEYKILWKKDSESLIFLFKIVLNCNCAVTLNSIRIEGTYKSFERAYSELNLVIWRSRGAIEP